MYGYIFFEVDQEGKPLYGAKLQEVLNCKLDNTVFLLSKEYKAAYETELLNQNVLEIPEEIMASVDDTIDEKMNRGALLAISKNEQLQDWLHNVILSQKLQVFTSIQKYISVKQACQQEMVLQNYLMGTVVSNGVTAGMNFEETGNENNEKLEFEIQKQNRMIQDLKKDVFDKGVYIDSILKHATNLDNDLKKYRDWYENSPRYGEKVEHLEKMTDTCTKLYNETLEKMDVLLTENLNLKKKYKVK